MALCHLESIQLDPSESHGNDSVEIKKHLQLLESLAYSKFLYCKDKIFIGLDAANSDF